MRLGAIFVAICMVVIAASAGATVYLGFGFSATEAIIVALSVLTALGLYSTVVDPAGRPLRGRQPARRTLAQQFRAGAPGDRAQPAAFRARRPHGHRAASCAGGHRPARRRDQRAQHAGPATRGNGGDLRGKVRRHGRGCRGPAGTGTGRRADGGCACGGSAGGGSTHARRRACRSRARRGGPRRTGRPHRRSCPGTRTCPGARRRQARAHDRSGGRGHRLRRRGKACYHPERNRRQSHRSLSAADRDAAAAKGALLRGNVAAAHRIRRGAAGRRLHPAGATRRPDGEHRQSRGLPLRAGRAAAAAQEPRYRSVLQSL